MAYADYEFYKDVFKGQTIADEENFESIELKASAYIDMITSGGITESDDENYNNKIKSAVCGVCDVLACFPDDSVVSESNDGYSVSYADDRRKNILLYNTARMYLPVSLLYRGL